MTTWNTWGAVFRGGGVSICVENLIKTKDHATASQ